MRTVKRNKNRVHCTEAQICPTHHVVVIPRISRRSGEDYWLCPFEHFLDHPNKQYEDVKVPYYDKEDRKKEQDYEIE